MSLSTSLQWRKDEMISVSVSVGLCAWHPLGVLGGITWGSARGDTPFGTAQAHGVCSSRTWSCTVLLCIGVAWSTCGELRHPSIRVEPSGPRARDGPQQVPGETFANCACASHVAYNRSTFIVHMVFPSFSDSRTNATRIVCSRAERSGAEEERSGG